MGAGRLGGGLGRRRRRLVRRWVVVGCGGGSGVVWMFVEVVVRVKIEVRGGAACRIHAACYSSVLLEVVWVLAGGWPVLKCL